MTVEVDRARVWMCSLCVYNLRCEMKEQQQMWAFALHWSVRQPRLIPFLASVCLPKEVHREFIEHLLTCNH